MRRFILLHTKNRMNTAAIGATYAAGLTDDDDEVVGISVGIEGFSETEKGIWAILSSCSVSKSWQ